MENKPTSYTKSTRHSKITGNFGEHLICYWLSRRGFETAMVDHIGIDLISRRPASKEILGISVKMRSKISNSKMEPLNIKVSDFAKVENACAAFGCKPYYAVVVDQNGRLTVILVSLKKLRELYPNPGKIVAFGLSNTQIEKYKKMKDVAFVEFNKGEGDW